MNFVILDLEWNGTYSRRIKSFINEIIEFGAVKVDEQLHIIDTFEALVRPQVGKKISGKIRMGKMLQQTRDLRVFPMTQEEYRDFRYKARGPKLLYAAIQNSRDTNDLNSMVDVIMPSSEVERANLVFQKMMYQQPEAPQKEQPERERQPEKEPGTPKKDSRSGRASRDTSTSSPMHAGSAARTTSDERPSVEGRLQDYRAQLEEQRRRAPARQKTKTRTKTR